MSEPVFLFIESERGFYVGHEPAGFGGVEGAPEWSKSPLDAKGFLKDESDLKWNLEIVRSECKGLEMWPRRMSERELTVMEVLLS